MARPLLPPKHIQVPTHIAYQLRLPFPILASYVLLRGLAWSSTVTPMLSMQELASLTGIPPSSLFRHMSRLSRMGVLSWRATGQGKLMLTFNDDPGERAVAGQAADAAPGLKNHPGTTRDSGILKNENRLSLLNIPPDSSDCLIIDDKEEVIKREGNSQFWESGIVSENPESSELVAIFRSLAHHTPNALQRELVGRQVTDPNLWRETVSHWLTHGWSPKNVAGMLDLYVRGGASGCVGCLDPQKFKRKAKGKQNDTRDALEELRREMGTVPRQVNR